MAIPGFPWAAIVGIIAAILFSWFRREIILTVVVSIFAAYLVLYLSGY